MKPQIRFRPDKDLILAILTGVIGSVVALAMFFLSGYMVTQSALGAPLYALMVLVVSVKFVRVYTRDCKIWGAFTITQNDIYNNYEMFGFNFRKLIP